MPIWWQNDVWTLYFVFGSKIVKLIFCLSVCFLYSFWTTCTGFLHHGPSDVLCLIKLMSFPLYQTVSVTQRLNLKVKVPIILWSLHMLKIMTCLFSFIFNWNDNARLKGLFLKLPASESSLAWDPTHKRLIRPLI